MTTAATDFINKLAGMPQGNRKNDCEIAREILEWISDRLATAGADAFTTIFTKPLGSSGQDAGISSTQTPAVEEIFDFLREGCTRVDELSAQAIVSILCSTLPVRKHAERAAFVVAAERRLVETREEDIEDLMRGLR
jgi:hypothetical protein